MQQQFLWHPKLQITRDRVEVRYFYFLLTSINILKSRLYVDGFGNLPGKEE
jgi:hypothetical protein